MRLPAIKMLVEQYTLEQLRAAETALLEELTVEIDLGPDEPGDQLTHVIGAISVLEEVAKGTDSKTALRNFTQRVRSSIS